MTSNVHHTPTSRDATSLPGPGARRPRRRLPLARAAQSGALAGDALVAVAEALAVAVGAIRAALGVHAVSPGPGRPVAPARLFALEIADAAHRGDLALVRAVAAVGAGDVSAVREALARAGRGELAARLAPVDLGGEALGDGLPIPAALGDGLPIPASPAEAVTARAARHWDELAQGLLASVVGDKLGGLLERIQARQALAGDGDELAFDTLADAAAPLYDNRIDRLGIEFTVDRLPFPCDVLDPRIVRIPAGKRSESHRHAHESLFYVVAGEGELTVGARRVRVTAGACVFVPRWTMHQSHNTGTTELKILGITDFHLTSKAQVGGDGQGRLERARAEREGRS